MEPRYKFENNGFEVSTDYKILWGLINKGVRVPAWLVYSEEYLPRVIWDLVEVKTDPKFNAYMIGSRGIGYGYYDDFDEFNSLCLSYCLHFILPSPPKHKDNE